MDTYSNYKNILGFSNEVSSNVVVPQRIVKDVPQ
jgi:hypothetical protein